MVLVENGGKQRRCERSEVSLAATLHFGNTTHGVRFWESHDALWAGTGFERRPIDLVSMERKTAGSTRADGV